MFHSAPKYILNAAKVKIVRENRTLKCTKSMIPELQCWRNKNHSLTLRASVVVLLEFTQLNIFSFPSIDKVVSFTLPFHMSPCQYCAQHLKWITVAPRNIEQLNHVGNHEFGLTCMGYSEIHSLSQLDLSLDHILNTNYKIDDEFNNKLLDLI